MYIPDCPFDIFFGNHSTDSVSVFTIIITGHYMLHSLFCAHNMPLTLELMFPTIMISVNEIMLPSTDQAYYKMGEH